MPERAQRSLDRRTAFAFAALGLFGAFFSPIAANAKVFGLKSTGSAGSSSEAPTVLFAFEESGTSATVIGNVEIGTTPVDADALALSAVHGLLAFQISGGNSQLLSIDPATGDATAVGSALTGRNIRAAGFSLSERLWVLDAASSDLLEINPSSGAVIGAPVNLKIGDTDFLIGQDGSDLAFFRSDDVGVVVFDNSAYWLDVGTGALTLLFQDTVACRCEATFVLFYFGFLS